MEYISYNTGTRALPDIYALALGRCAPSGIVRIYQAKHSCLCYNYYIILQKFMDFLLFSVFGKVLEIPYRMAGKFDGEFNLTV